MSGPRFDTAVVVLGTPASLTCSVVAALQSAGLSPPRTSATADSNGGRHFVESPAIAQVSDAVLAELAPQSVDDISAEVFQRPSLINLRRRAELAFLDEFPSGCKPLIVGASFSRALPFWQNLLHEMVARTTFLIVVSHPFDVSLGKSGDLLTWASHYLDAERRTRRFPRAYLLSDATDAEVERKIALLANESGLSVSVEPAECAQDRSLIGSEAPLSNQLDAEGLCRAAAADLFDILADRSREKMDCDEVRPGEELKLARVDATITALAAIERERPPETASTLQNADEDIDAEPELERIKRKYRAAQHHLELERDAHRLTRDALIAAEAAIERHKRTISWRAYSGVSKILGRMKSVAGRIVGSDRRRLKAAAASIEASQYFDPQWYITRYGDVASAGLDPAIHFLEHGWREGRDPGPSFSTSAYLKANSDVARAGINPLLHFIEFGALEGRGVSADTRLRSNFDPPPGEPFGDPAPCIGYQLPSDVSVRWIRAASMSRNPNGEVFRVGGLPVGFCADSEFEKRLRHAFKALAALSGYSDAISPEELARDEKRPHLLDAWHLTDRRLRCRWNLNGDPMVVRAFQHDPDRAGELVMVAEQLVISSLDYVDVSSTNPYFPLLFVISDKKANVQASELLAFPSACRGGIHYSELIAAMGEPTNSQPWPITTITFEWSASLLSIHRNASSAMIRNLEVDLSGADGTHLLFQKDFRTWLNQVMRIAIKASQGSVATPRLKPLIDAIALSPFIGRSAGGTLQLASDMVPTISILTATGRGESRGHNAVMSLIVASPDPAEPATLIRMPASDSAALRTAAPGLPTPWPYFRSARGAPSPDSGEVAAIRLTDVGLPTEAELLVPIMDTGEHVSGAAAITWLICPSEWSADALATAFQALALQEGSATSELRLVCGPAADAVALARRFFGRRVRAIDNNSTARRDFSTPLAGYLGPGVILHNKRTSAVLASLLDDDSVCSASCMLIGSERRGKGYNTSIADSGTVAGSMQRPPPTGHRDSTHERLWRSTYPLIAPPRDFWVVRCRSLARWAGRVGALSGAEGMHACTSLVTASYLGDRSNAEPRFQIPPADERLSARIEAVFG